MINTKIVIFVELGFLGVFLKYLISKKIAINAIPMRENICVVSIIVAPFFKIINIVKSKEKMASKMLAIFSFFIRE
ncbi:hypothetical protein [Bacillus thuringiensis]|uniref:hypothetical protein n=1 Tax=Bacillus thuringiensis TaxID=1428 RepID=UPI001FB7A4AB|nr:hypothetical protein [Bacillus thuringiensis]